MSWQLNDSAPASLAQSPEAVPAEDAWNLNDVALLTQFDPVPSAWGDGFFGGIASMHFPIDVTPPTLAFYLLGR